MPRDINLSTDHWERLGDMSARHKLLYTLMYFKVDYAGVVTHPLKCFSDMAGFEYSQSDVTALGKLVIRLDEKRLLVTDFLKNQYRNLSHKCPGHNRVFDCLRSHWGLPEKPASGPAVEPFVKAWHEMGIGGKVPDFITRYPGFGPKKEWQIKLEKEAERAMSVPIPDSWNPLLRNAFRDWMQMRMEFLIKQTSIQDAQHFLWTHKHAASAVKRVNGWLAAGVMPHRIEEVITSAYQGSFLMFKTPKMNDEQLRRTDTQNQ